MGWRWKDDYERYPVCCRQQLSQAVQSKIIESLKGLEVNPRQKGCKKIVGSVNLWQNRSEDYPIIYSIDDNHKVVDVNAVRHRSGAYR